MVYCEVVVKRAGFIRHEQPGTLLPFRLVVVCVVLAPLLSPLAVAACKEKPTVWMDEATAASHLLSKRDLVAPTARPLTRIAEVVLMVTVDREGAICDAQPLTGPKDVKAAAVKIVLDHWRYRRFLVDWKPVVAQFPVTVKAVPVRSGTPPMTIADESHHKLQPTRA